ncbi:hypothetical protein CPB83DRAFT_222827 [Crepidotus variabilis]|uniref:Uncharacterized protein n=1 Tax=Crepidotus variabilis TaxID=179855 RepID=A0A9P6JV22_9AGAR|nr:hypothetical protein CPB83DRAFT_222827 [Crepidotus variabilis]
MTDWKSLEGNRQAFIIFDKILYLCLGFYLWEWAGSLDFEWKVLTGRVKLRWPLIFYFLNRYLMLSCLIASVVVADKPIHSLNACKPLMIFVQASGNLCLGLASINLALRTIAIWRFNVIVTGLLVVISIAQWVIIMTGAVRIQVSWTPRTGCHTIQTNFSLRVVFLYTICFDLLVLGLSAFKLRTTIPASETRLRPLSIAVLVLRHGIIFFAISCLVNTAEVVFIELNLSPLMNAMFSVPAETITTVVACRAVRSLVGFFSGIQTTERAPHRSIMFNHHRTPVGEAMKESCDITLPSDNAPYEFADITDARRRLYTTDV